MRVEFFFAPGSRYSYLAASQVPALERETGCTVEWRPVSGTEIRSFRGRDAFLTGRAPQSHTLIDRLSLVRCEF